MRRVVYVGLVPGRVSALGVGCQFCELVRGFVALDF